MTIQNIIDLYNSKHIFSLPWKQKKCKADNELISSPNHHQLHSTKSLSENLPVFVLEKEDNTKRYSLYDKWTKQDNIKKSFEKQDQSKDNFNKKEFVEEDNKLPWEIKNSSSSLSLTKDIKNGSTEVGGGGGDEEKSSANVNTSLSGKQSLLLPNNNKTKSPLKFHHVMSKNSVPYL